MTTSRFFRFILMLLLFVGSIFNVEAQKVFKVLAIGNSFSQDAVEQHLYELAAAQGKTLLIGNAYIGGCSIDRHWDNAQTGKTDYAYRKVVNGVKTNYPGKDLKSIIQDEDWDLITLQQASHFSGQLETYKNLTNLKNYVRQTATNKKVKFAFHMTWAYAQNSTHKAFKDYGKDQLQMYRAICKTVAQATKTAGIKKIIPSGIAIQNAREEAGDILNRDGYHLAINFGRYTAACTWCEFLIHKSVVGNTAHPSNVSSTDALVAQKAAHLAIRNAKKILKKSLKEE